MASNRIEFFATIEDLVPGLKLLEAAQSLKFVRCGLFPTNQFEVMSSPLALPRLGHALNGARALCERYLILRATDELIVREVPQAKGGVRYAVDQLANPVSATFEPGGVFDTRFLLGGSVTTASRDAAAKALCRDFGHAITRGFRKCSGYLVGLNAAQQQRDGVRLITMHINEGEEYDLRCA